MSLVSFILLVVAILYIAGGIFEFPIMFEGNFKTKWMIEKIGRKNHKKLLIGIGLVLLIIAIVLN